MDVNETLQQLRQAIVDLELAEEWDALTEASMDAQEHFRALDEWLSKGGFLPADWNKGRATRRYGNPRPAFGEE